MIGSVLDKYRILEKIGEGGMASVYRGEHLTLGREVAVKILHPHLSNQARNRQRFAREARAIEHLRHDNILRIEDYSGEDAQNCFIVTEFVDGQTLQQLLVDHGALPSEVVARIGIRLADALQYAHSLGIIHRDLKPENVMIKKDGTVKLMDFGIARFLDEMHLTVTGALVGSPAYMSPEQAMERVLDSRSDLFSLGTLLFHLVTGQLPFAGNNPSIVLRNIIEGNRPGVADLAHDVAGPLADLVHGLLQVDPEDRPRTALDVREQLIAVLDAVDIELGDPQWSLQAWLVDPKGYSDRLDAWLREVLLRKGKARLEARDHLGALQLFNRLLTIDERLGVQNQEVLALVQGMHGTRKAPRRARGMWIGGLSLLLAAGLVTWLLWPDPPVAPQVEPATASGATPTQAQPETPLQPDPVRLETSPSAVAEPASPPDAATVAGAGAASTDPPLAPVRLPGPPLLGPDSPRTLTPRPTGPSVSSDAPSAEVAQQAAWVTVHVPGSWGYIYIDGERKGRVPGLLDPIEVSPGTHTLSVRNDLAFPHEEQFTVSPGETRNITTPALQRRPATLRLSARLDPACTLRMDGASLGTVAALGSSVTLDRPDQRHAIEIVCPDQTTRHQVGPLLAGETVELP